MQHFGLPLAKAASTLKVGSTVLKRLCRTYHIQRWPFRKLASITKLCETIMKAGEEHPDHENLEHIMKFRCAAWTGMPALTAFWSCDAGLSVCTSQLRYGVQNTEPSCNSIRGV
jgi:hypothetical protein